MTPADNEPDLSALRVCADSVSTSSVPLSLRVTWVECSSVSVTPPPTPMPPTLPLTATPPVLFSSSFLESPVRSRPLARFLLPVAHISRATPQPCLTPVAMMENSASVAATLLPFDAASSDWV